jgi:hypothetical protein
VQIDFGKTARVVVATLVACPMAGMTEVVTTLHVQQFTSGRSREP